MPFIFTGLDLEGVFVIEPVSFYDNRGFFRELYKESDFKAHGISASFVQDNHSFSSKGVLRGLHYQVSPKTQGKLICVISGSVWNVVVDIRKGSPTFLKWTSIELSNENYKMLYMPPGFANGFLVLSDNAHLLYKCTGEYSTELERGIRWDDPDISINWPRTDVIVSERDKNLPYLRDAETL